MFAECLLFASPRQEYFLTPVSQEVDTGQFVREENTVQWKKQGRSGHAEGAVREGVFTSPSETHGCSTWPLLVAWVDEQEDQGEDGDSAWGLVQQWGEQEITEHFSVAGVRGDMRTLGLEVRQP